MPQQLRHRDRMSASVTVSIAAEITDIGGCEGQQGAVGLHRRQDGFRRRTHVVEVRRGDVLLPLS